MCFGNYGDSVIVVDGMLMYYSSLGEEHYLTMGKDFSEIREVGSTSKRKRARSKNQ
jgi:hypothetical protein